MNITLQNLNKNIRGNHLTVNKRALKSLANKVLQSEEADFDVEITLVDDSYIKELNKKYRNVDNPTDVLSFLITTPFQKSAVSKPKTDNRKPITDIADIYISLDRAKEQAESRKMEFKVEVAHLLIHGILHLLGYEHSDLMTEKEEHYLRNLKCQSSNVKYHT